MEAIQFRTARPTNDLKAILRFYEEGLGLPVLGSFTGHAGYDGVMFGLPDSSHHLEFTQFKEAQVLPEPTREHLLVFYFESPAEYALANRRLQSMDISPVAPENPYWEGKSETYADPDNWRVVLFNGLYKP